MRVPGVRTAGQRGQRQLVAFGNVNYGMDYQEGELRASLGISSSLFPAMTTRLPRALEGSYQSPTAIYAKGALCVVDGTGFFYGGELKGQVEPGEKSFASIGTKVLICPDKKYYDTQTGEFGQLELTYMASAGQVTFTASTLTTTGADFAFNVGDAVEVEGCISLPENNKTVIIRAAEEQTLTFYDNTFTEGTEVGAVRVSRKIPDLTMICEHDNRIWGVAEQTIYGSALGDPFNFYRYDGLSTDSYAVAVGTDGAFTGVASYGSQICFFKEDALHRMYGNKPSNYSLTSHDVPGVQAGSAASMVVVNETLFYKGRLGVYAYAGSLPDLISGCFGPVRFGKAVAGSDGEKYYISMERNDGGWEIYTYDLLKGIWLREDTSRARGFAAMGGVVYAIIGEQVMAMTAEGEKIFPWLMELAPFTETVNNRKGYSRLSARIDLDPGSWVLIEISCDGGPWRQVLRTPVSRARTVVAPIQPVRCDKFAVRFSGRGRFVLQSLTRDFYAGSDS